MYICMCGGSKEKFVLYVRKRNGISFELERWKVEEKNVFGLMFGIGTSCKMMDGVCWVGSGD